MSRYRCALGVALLLLAVCSVAADDNTSPSPEALVASELLLFQEIPEVVTAAKETQPITESPSTISIITAEDIRRSGATTVPDVLRSIPGLDVMAVTASDVNVSARGFNRLLANKMLVLVDGRSVYQDMLGVTLWATLPLVLDDIERIEVVRGPGSALYGANAFNGIINIITKTPQETPTLLASHVTGAQGMAATSLLHAGRVRDTDYKISLATDRLDAWDEDANQAMGLDRTSHDFDRWNVALQRPVARGVITGYAGASDGHVQILPDEAWGIIDYASDLEYWNLVYEESDLLVQGFWNHGEQVVLSDLDDWVEFHTYDLEVQKRLQPRPRHSMILGATWRHNKVDLSEEQDYTQRLYGAYVQDHYVNDKGVSVVAGLRFDHHPLTGEHLSPRASVVYSPRKGESYRASASTAYRNPSFFESYLDLRQNDVMPGVDLWWYGNESLGAEKITSYEVGYQAVVNPRLRWEVDAFYNKLDDFIVKTPVAGPPRIEFTYLNSGGATAKGVEAGLEFILAPELRGFANYSYQDVTDDDTGDRLRSAPRNKVNVGLRYTQSQFTADAFAHYAASTDWEGRYLPSYTLVNARVGYTLPERDLEVFLAAYNLAKDTHQEYPTGVEIGRRVTAGVRYSF
ncbi:MAG: TonB-dependent receptor [Armatimonadota bacterium]|nr:MAG: TonB-dependent receptor [Armatimonadota bacterium]